MSELAAVYVNGAAQTWRPGLTVADLVAADGRAPASVASALNGDFVARDARAGTAVQPGDQLTLFQAIVGG